MKAMILAAGLGTRLRPVTNHLAKPAVPFLNIPMLHLSFALLEKAGATRFVINSHHLSHQISALASAVPGFTGEPSIITHEDPVPLGSGGGVWHAREHLQGEANFLLANGDEVILPQSLEVLPRLQQAHQQSGALATILVMRHSLVGTQFGGVWADKDGKVQGFGKDPHRFPGCTGFHYIGLQILSSRVFKYLPPGESNILYDALASAIAQGEQVRILETQVTWFETGNPADYLAASQSCMQLLNDSRLAKGDDRVFLLELGQRFWQGSPSSLSQLKSLNADASPLPWAGFGSQIAASAVERGSLILAGENVVVEPGALLRGFVILGADTKVSSRGAVENCVLLPGCVVSAQDDVKNEIFLPR